MSEHARQVIVLHKGAGHLRLALPALFANPGSARIIEAALLHLPGVRLASVELRGSKLAVHFDPRVSSHRQIALALDGVLPEAAIATTATAGSPSASSAGVPKGLPPKLAEWPARALQWADTAKQKTLAAAQALQAQLVKSTTGSTVPAISSSWRRALSPALINERSLINFANDVTAFYLIRVHWDLITNQWLKAPLRHFNAWLTLSYLTFLLVRHRKHHLATGPAAPALPVAESGDHAGASG